MIGDIFGEIRRVLAAPSAGKDWYEWALMGFGHYMLGALIFDLLSFSGSGVGAPDPLVGACFGALYFVIKEVGDLRRGGTLADGLTDAGFVSLGACGPFAFAIPLCWSIVAAGVIARISRRRA